MRQPKPAIKTGCFVKIARVQAHFHYKDVDGGAVYCYVVMTKDANSCRLV